MIIEFCGHSCFLLRDGRHSVIIDPFLSGNPVAVRKPEEVSVEAVLLTHGHGDHIGDAIAIAQRNNATIIAPYELATYSGKKGAQVHPMHIGGGRDFPFGRVKLTQAWHGSAVFDDGDIPIYTGNPCGFILTIGSTTVYHAGDTGLFGDMKLIGDRNDIDCAFLPIGDNFTMGIDDALYALELLQPKKVIPLHYDTFPVIEVEVSDFTDGAKQKGYECIVLKPGESTAL